MRDYKVKMDRYRLPDVRYRALRAYCKRGATEEIRGALKKTGGGTLSCWIEKHVCLKGWRWSRLQAAGVPCNEDTFRLYRAKFYWELDKLVGDVDETGRLL